MLKAGINQFLSEVVQLVELPKLKPANAVPNQQFSIDYDSHAY
jgi:hypothetical protein